MELVLTLQTSLIDKSTQSKQAIPFTFNHTYLYQGVILFATQPATEELDNGEAYALVYPEGD